MLISTEMSPTGLSKNFPNIWEVHSIFCAKLQVKFKIIIDFVQPAPNLRKGLQFIHFSAKGRVFRVLVDNQFLLATKRFPQYFAPVFLYPAPGSAQVPSTH
jgi:hypothetical protein